MAPKLGGFSRILSKLDRPDLLDILISKGGRESAPIGGYLTERGGIAEELGNIMNNNSLLLNNTMYINQSQAYLPSSVN